MSPQSAPQDAPEASRGRASAPNARRPIQSRAQRPGAIRVAITLTVRTRGGDQDHIVSLPFKGSVFPSRTHLAAIATHLIANTHEHLELKNEQGASIIAARCSLGGHVPISNWHVAIVDPLGGAIRKIGPIPAQSPEAAAFSAAWQVAASHFNPLAATHEFQKTIDASVALFVVPDDVEIDPAIEALTDLDRALRPILKA